MARKYPLVSVVIPTFNRATTLATVVGTVQTQSENSLEIIIVDDCSTDNTFEVARAIARDDSRIVVAQTSNNLGPSGSRNYGMRLATGKYVAFLDSDDDWAPDKLRRQLASIAAVPSPVFSFGATWVASSQALGRVRPSRAPLPDEPLSEFLYVSDQFAQTSSFIITADLVGRIEFRENLRRFEDHMFLLDAAEIGAQVVYLPDPLVTWRDEARTDRLSLRQGAHAAGVFVETAGPKLTPRARQAFLAKEVVPTILFSEPLRAFALVVRALRCRAITGRQAALIALRCLLPPTIYRALRRLVRDRYSLG